MFDLMLRIAARYLSPLLFALSVFVVYRGHNMPGGGFIGGLLAAAAVLLLTLAGGWRKERAWMLHLPGGFLVFGLLLSGLSGLLPLFQGLPFLTGLWLPPLAGVSLGTPVLFDVGVYFTVFGFTLKSAHALGTEEGG